MSDGLTDLYQEVILDHSRHPRNFGAVDGADRSARGNNPLCGDRVSVYLSLDGDKITDAQFDARGCAISLASASMMTEMIKGKSVDEAKSLFEKFHKLVTGEENAVGELAELETLSGVKDFPTRIKCATLAWHAMVAAIDGTDEEVKTE
ncbi:MAG: SUF system NifU family Fe-S cluster assembly protein [Rhodospirillaceae bacterium]|nr:SUF system NifU family Fe-S cluster assembly protein [Rhodospirillaceae bacterium]|tara:strand:+ start:20072 stop:20518 length:447 start_codon:yes stop_codon:yes gene_type:complete